METVAQSRPIPDCRKEIKAAVQPEPVAFQSTVSVTGEAGETVERELVQPAAPR